MKKKIDKLKFYNKSAKHIMSVSEDGNVIWHSKENKVNKLELIEAIHTTLSNMPDLQQMMRNKVENDIYNEILDICNKCVTIEEVISELEGRLIFKKIKQGKDSE